MLKLADKGSAISILDRSQDLWEDNRHVSDPDYYITLNNPTYPQTILMLGKITQRKNRKNSLMPSKTFA